MSHDRVPQEENQGEASVDSLLERASDEARRLLKTIQEIAGTTSCKGVQISGLKKWAKQQGCWISEISLLGIFTDRGSENEVYIDNSAKTVYKLNDFRYSDDNLEPFFQRLRLHNALFPDCAYSLIGFAENRDGVICVVLSQPFIRADREASIEEIAGALALMGFMPQQEGEYFSNTEIDIFDAVPNNVLHGIDGNLYFIDTILSPASENYIETYQSLSPRAKKL